MSRKYFYHIFGLTISLLSLSSYGETRVSPCGPTAMCLPGIGNTQNNNQLHAYSYPQNPYQSQYNQPLVQPFQGPYQQSFQGLYPFQYNQPFTQPFQNPYPFQYNQPFAQPYNQPFVQPFQGWNPGGYPFYGVPPNR